MSPSLSEILPEDGTAGTLVGRVWRAGHPAGPSVVAIRGDGVFDLSATVPTMADLCNAPDPTSIARNTPGERVGGLQDLVGDLLAPVDLQALKAAGVTFAVSLLERLIEEHAKGDPARAEQVRGELNAIIGADVSAIKPGSPEAEALKKTLMARGAWSPYLEVGIGPYAEIFTKAPPMAAVGYGAEIGIRPDSDWNNPEPEVTLIVSAKGRIVGATLGNDVNLRDIEGRSALLLGIAKDNNASCALGPFIRLFDDSFSLDDVRQAKVDLEVTGPDQFRLRGSSDLSKISRDPTDLVAQAMSAHQYPDGMALMTGTLFAPTEPRKPGGTGFTHMVGDLVSIRSPRLGTLTNRVAHCDKIAPWTFGTGALMRNLAARGLLR
ncbi:fumarylacetoacetate hydrolase family protein [Reyranella sp.]|uniref:fumarylacetoacetate hydrolase family protein n=1 Tax=Reyranella sp. TaxID=1929291 RepID=UPI000BCE5B49|nr:fumarylacetoacetate hydrolase family protein [Reyranella sp.]OYY46007.1 MAG: fumarylacetoacetate hydrolase [Rhodospirillales bacterium 35-66-84]OYZ96387.1 MAG: fumarylacetoacetate hydrolase [Rhodospirillales bacterium 24-66-33]OZB28450.1 MAG: fumarylacetoacetate hydrolase [Rhodospirillales bacterium 39-66-50]HQS14340.1 fumarylacetoacetate hydrolase family protein [Reyranella sp.]HQT11336.1 fumarylacetoacetate hydrolase family protein [Reyranella sp.]